MNTFLQLTAKYFYLIIFRLARECYSTSFTLEKQKHLPAPSAFNLLMDRINLASFWGIWQERKLAKPIWAKVNLLFKKIKQTTFFKAVNTLHFCHIYEVSIYLCAFYYSLNMASLKTNHFTEHKAETPWSLPNIKCHVYQSCSFHLWEAPEKVTLFP